MAQGQVKVDHMIQAGETVLNTTSPTGQDFIIIEMKGLQQDFESLTADIKQQKEKQGNYLYQVWLWSMEKASRFMSCVHFCQLTEKVCVLWREYKDEYELVSDWLQQMDAEVKAHKLATKGTLEEKSQSLDQCKGLVNQLMNGQEKLDTLNKLAETLLSSHLDSYIGNQQRHLNTRYQVLINLAKVCLLNISYFKINFPRI